MAPSPSTSGIIAAWLIRTKLPKAQEVRVDRGDDGAERHQHGQRRPGAPAASAGARGPLRRLYARPSRRPLRHLASVACGRAARGARARFSSAVLDLPADAAPDVVPVELAAPP